MLAALQRKLQGALIGSESKRRPVRAHDCRVLYVTQRVKAVVIAAIRTKTCNKTKQAQTLLRWQHAEIRRGRGLQFKGKSSRGSG